MHQKFDFGWGSPSELAVGAHSAPQKGTTQTRIRNFFTVSPVDSIFFSLRPRPPYSVDSSQQNDH